MANEKLDVIDRKALIAEYDRVHIGEPGKARKLIEEAPTVDAVEVVHGLWEKYARYVICSVCDTGYCYYKNETDRFHYCPNCGADMRDGDGNG